MLREVLDGWSPARVAVTSFVTTLPAMSLFV
jgi:hypothetical protein